MSDANRSPQLLRRLRWQLLLTRAGLVSEVVVRAFWPLFAIVMVVLAALMLGIHDLVPVEAVWGAGALAGLGALACLIRGVRRLHWPGRDAALERLDQTMKGHPIRAVLDQQAIGDRDAGSVALWQAHQARMTARASAARAPAPDLVLNRRDPFALRYAAMLMLATALLFGSVWRVGSVTEMTPGGGDLATGPTWEGWLEPPRYTGRPTVYLADLDAGDIRVAEGTRVTLRFYGEIGALSLLETVSDQTGEKPAATEPVQELVVSRDGALQIEGPGGRAWQITTIADDAPRIEVAGQPETEAIGRMSLPFSAADDYGVVAGRAVIALDNGSVDRRFGLTIDPDERDGFEVELPMPIAGDRREFTENLIEDFSKHPWANLPVTFTLHAEDAAGQTANAEPLAIPLPGRRFFDPLAAAVIEQRRDLLWARANGGRVAQMLRAISHRPDGLFRSETSYLRLRFILRRLESLNRFGLKPEHQEELAEAMWDLAIQLEEGDLSDALERLRRAQERLSEAMKNGASDQEIAELMQELRRATDDYLRQLSRQAQQDGQQQQGEQSAQNQQNSMQMDMNDLQQMMDRIQELMEQGRMAEAQQALQELQQMMENMRVTQGQGQGGQSEGERAMEGLAETLREQQGLSDQAFRDLQEQFNPGANQGQSQGNQGRNGGQGQGQSHDQPGQQGQGQGQQQGGQGSGDLEGALADRQQALREELRRQQGQMPGSGTPEGEAARDALDRAGRAMEGAEDALREDDYAGAIDRQSEAMEALREGMRALGEQMAQQNQSQPGQGAQEGDAQARNRDPLGRDTGKNGSMGTEENLLQGEDVYRRARELLDEIRRRSGDGERPDVERDYLRRLLDRF